MWRSDKTKNNVLRAFNSCTELVVLDVETTGFSAERDRVIQFSGIKFVISDGVMFEKERFDVYINPEFSLPEKITEITGITDKMLSEADFEADVFPSLYTFLGESPNVCGQNVAFDIRFLTAMYERYNQTLNPMLILDTLEMARDVASTTSKAPKNNKLETLAKHYGVDYGLSFHNSMDDVIACSRLLKIFYEEYKERESERKVITDGVKTKVLVKSLRYWPGYRGHARIYIYTDYGDFFYDIFKKTWGKGSSCICDIETIDMERLREDSLRFANVTTEQEFARFRG